MNIFEELKPQIEAFKDARDHVVSTASLLPTDGVKGCGDPPFAVDDGTSYYAVIDKEGVVKPLPFGYQVANDDIEMVGVDAVLSTLMSLAGNGAGIVRYVPLVKDFEVPGSRAFCLETAEDSEAWGALSESVDTFQQLVSEKALFNFNQRLTNALARLYEGCDVLESVDQAISGLLLQSSFLPVLFLRSYRHALEAIEEELSDGEDDDEE